MVYKETRAQELVEAMWATPDSPWYDRIDMLGDQGRRFVTQAAWIRSLTASVIKSFQGRGVTIGGLFGGEGGDREPALAWSRAQQAPFLIYTWKSIHDSVAKTKDKWATELRGDWKAKDGSNDPAFAGQQSLLNTDQGVRGVLQVLNDLTMVRAESLGLAAWVSEDLSDAPTDSAITSAMASLKGEAIGTFLDAIAAALASWDWRSSSAQSLSVAEQQAKMRFGVGADTGVSGLTFFGTWQSTARSRSQTPRRKCST